MSDRIPSLASIAGAPTKSATLCGKTYLVATLRPRDVADLQAWLMRTIPAPKQEARKLIEGLPAEVAIAIWDREMKSAPQWPPTLNTPEGQAALVSPDGMAEAVYLILRHTVVGFTREQARELADELTMQEFNDLLDAAAPEGPTGGDGGDADPKAPNGRPRTSVSANS